MFEKTQPLEDYHSLLKMYKQVIAVAERRFSCKGKGLPVTCREGTGW
jgi:hypothetical protein